LRFALLKQLLCCRQSAMLEALRFSIMCCKKDSNSTTFGFPLHASYIRTSRLSLFEYGIFCSCTSRRLTQAFELFVLLQLARNRGVGLKVYMATNED
jgi:hypothetical protein